MFDNFYIKKFCPRNLDKFAFAPSIGVVGALLTIWNGGMFDGTVIQVNSYSITIKLFCRLDNKDFHVTNIYGLASSPKKQGFITWLMNFDTTSFDEWLIVGDFNLIKEPANRNKPGGDLNEMNLFNEAISDLDLIEIPFSGKEFT